ncbi:efflux transporter outer membrane subunit [Opitutales bacterium ASA1]|uniref:efflux transporter outer membrane subunit n=1 Tax=Congregicoccus parvus TaxID=3081749 RepID=UPI002B2AB97F|nr:efflux transporter outer membrane subunit [Opitutales bacterium ASA1]
MTRLPFSTRLSTGASVLVLAFSGCVTSPRTAQRPEAVPDAPSRWTAPAATTSNAPENKAVSDDWLLRLGDPRLPDLVEQALARNHDLRALAASLESTRAASIIAGADRLPQIGVGLDAARFQNAVKTAPGEAVGAIAQSRQLGANVRWEIDLWGKLRDRGQAALADLEAAEADFAGARLSLAAGVAKAWFRTSTSRLQLQLAEETVRNFEATADLVRSRFEAGIGTSLELRLALANAASAAALLEQRRQELDSAVRTLETLLGRYPANMLATIDALPELQVTVPAGIPSEVLQRRPDLVAAERRLAAADARTREARKARLPSLSLTGSGGTASNDLDDLLDADFEVWSIAAGLAQPLIQGGRLRAAADRNAALAERAHADYLSAVLEAFREVESALAAEHLLRRREENLREFAEQSAGAERLAQDEYEAGLSDIVTVLESQRRALDARSSYLLIREQRLRNRVDLHLALGGDFGAGGATNSAPPAVDLASHDAPTLSAALIRRP